ncbi:MAG: YkgJ family cysteine cluster protein [Phycisphaerales bacterium JB043]
MSQAPAKLFKECWTHAGDERVTREIDLIHESVRATIESNKPLCQSSGRCCHFNTYGHRLYTTALEAAYTLRSLGNNPLPVLTNARRHDACPFLRDNLCTIHEHRPAGCRIFFCDPSATEWTQHLYEHIHVAVKELHTRFSIPYLYIEWRSLLEVYDMLGLSAGSAVARDSGCPPRP